MTMTIYPPQRGFLHCSTGAASATFTFCFTMTLELSNFQKWGITDWKMALSTKKGEALTSPFISK